MPSSTLARPSSPIGRMPASIAALRISLSVVPRVIMRANGVVHVEHLEDAGAAGEAGLLAVRAAGAARQSAHVLPSAVARRRSGGSALAASAS